MIQIKSGRPVSFVTLLTIGETELRSCTRCGAIVPWKPAPKGDVMELVHRKWHEEQEA